MAHGIFLRNIPFRSFVVIIICTAILVVEFSASSHLCTKDRSFLCRADPLEFNVDNIGIDLVPDNIYSNSKVNTISDITLSKDFVASIFHPPRISSW